MDRYLHQAMIYSSNGSATRFAEELTNVAAVKDYCRTRGLTPGTQWAYGQILVDPIARSLGMNSTSYRNASGLPGKTYTGTPYNVTTLEDKAKLYDFALSEFSKEILDITSQVSYRGVLNTNKMLETAGGKFATEGNDGLKTGFTEGARYNFDATLLRSNIRYQTQVSGRPDINSRFADTIDLAEMAIGAHEAQLEAVKTQRRFGVPFAAEFEGRIVDAMGLAIP